MANHGEIDIVRSSIVRIVQGVSEPLSVSEIAGFTIKNGRTAKLACELVIHLRGGAEDDTSQVSRASQKLTELAELYAHLDKNAIIPVTGKQVEHGIQFCLVVLVRDPAESCVLGAVIAVVYAADFPTAQSKLRYVLVRSRHELKGGNSEAETKWKRRPN